MATDKSNSKKRRRSIVGAGLRTLGRGALRNIPGYDHAKSWQKTGQDWYETLGNLKGAAMKLGQIASQYQDLLPPQLIDQLTRLQRNAEPWAFADLEPVLQEHWDEKQRAQIAHIDEQSLAAASIGQVHAARLQDGREVVIKIRYPGVADSIDADVANLGKLLKWSRFLPVGGRDLDGILNELRERFVEETDYRNELANLNTLRQLNMRGFELPEPIESLCTEAVLVTTRLDSRPIEEADASLGAVLIEAINRQVFELGALHADPHPGNFGITERGNIALYDFGCIKRLEPETRQAMRAVLASAMNQDWHGVHDGLRQLGAVTEESWDKHADTYRDIYARHAEATLAPLRGRRPYTFQHDALIDSIRGELRKSIRYWSYFKPAPDMVFVMRTLSGLYWILRSFQAEVDIYGEIEKIIRGDYGPDMTTSGD